MAILELPEWAALAPAAVLGITGLLLLVIDMVDPDSENATLLAGTGVLGTLVSLGFTAWYLAAGTGQQPPAGLGAIELFAGNIVVDGMSLFLSAIVASVTALVLVASHDYIADMDHQAEYYALVLLAASGMALMATANSLATAFVSLELASLPSYALVAYIKDNRGSVEAGLKYFLIGAVSSAVFAYGISLVYAVTGELRFAAIASALGGAEMAGMLGLGVLFVIGGFAFKTASVPFHFWAPEAYEGAPSPISAFLSSASKAAGFVLAFRVFVVAFEPAALGAAVDWTAAFTILAVVTMTVGNFAAATQTKVKRMLAYSSIGHAGYVLIALAAYSADAGGLVLGAGMAHLMVYGFMNTGAFLFIALTEHWEIGRTFEDFNGLGSRAPLACAAMTIFLFSLAGLPVGAGFLSKFALLMAAVNGGVALLAAALIINSALSLYYYSRVVKAMWIEEPADGGFDIDGYPTGLYLAIVVAAVATVILLPGFGPVIEIARDAGIALA